MFYCCVMTSLKGSSSSLSPPPAAPSPERISWWSLESLQAKCVGFSAESVGNAFRIQQPDAGPCSPARAERPPVAGPRAGLTWGGQRSSAQGPTECGRSHRLVQNPEEFELCPLSFKWGIRIKYPRSIFSLELDLATWARGKK